MMPFKEGGVDMKYEFGKLDGGKAQRLKWSFRIVSEDS